MKSVKTRSLVSVSRFAAMALCPLSVCLVSIIATPLTAVAAAQDASADPTVLMQQAAMLEASAHWQQAAQVYGQAAAAYASEGQSAKQATALKKSAAMYETYAHSLLGGVTPVATTAPINVAAASPARQTGSVPLPLDKSTIVRANKFGGLSVASANGSPIDGVKISKHDINIQSPSIVVAPNGVIHVAFLEQHATGIESSIYHRSSSDGGSTWSEAKNLSEVMPDLNVGSCQIAADGAGRIYVIWRVAPMQYGRAAIDPHADTGNNNLVYRVLSGGQWNGKTIPIHQMASNADQNIGSASYFVSTDPGGNVHVVWNEDPAIVHPEVMFSSTQHAMAVGIGLVMESTLNGATPSAPREIYLPPVSQSANGMGPVCDGMDMLNGYVDLADKAHFVALVAPVRGAQSNPFQMIENGAQAPGVTLPGSTFEYWSYPPTLLVDAQGRKHIVTMYAHSEQANVRDYTVGSDEEPKTIRSVKGTAGKLLGFEAFQGAAGRMVAIMHMNDTGSKTDEELYVSMSSGGAWSTPVNVTNNSGRLAFHSTNTSSRSNVATMSWGYPGAATGTFDRSGHLLLLYVRNKMAIFGSNAFGVQLAGGSSATPNLMFLRF